MSIHILEAKAFFDASVPIGDSQRLVLLPSPRPVAPGDEIYLRDEPGNMIWTADVLLVHETAGLSAWNGGKHDDRQMYVVLGWLARIHPGTLSPTKAKLQASWVTLNSRTLQTALPWRSDRILIYHHTMRLVEVALTPKEVEKAQSVGCIAWHRSGHWIVPMGEARKRLLVEVLGQPLVCALCGGPIPTLEDATQDHRLPSSQGGPDVLANVQLAHKSCNEVKGNALPEQYPPLFVPPTPVAEVPSFRRGRGRQRGRGGRGAHMSPPGIIPRPHVPSELPTILPPALAAQLAATTRNGGAAVPNTAPPAVTPGVPAAVAPAPALAVAAAAVAAPTSTTKSENSAKGESPARATTRSQRESAAANSGGVAEPVRKRRGRPASAKTAAAAAGGAPADGTAAPASSERVAGAAAPARKRGRPRKADRVAATQPTTPAPAASGAGKPPAPATVEEAPAAVSPEWLEEVQSASWSRVVAMSAGADWAANTATLRTMGPLRRNQAAKALAEAVLLAEHAGPEGRFALLQWADRTVLIEERGEEKHCFQVRMLRALTPEVYVWHLSQFGRRTPLGVAMALLSLWRSGTADAEGRVLARKGDASLVLGVRDDRFVECRWQESGTAVA